MHAVLRTLLNFGSCCRCHKNGGFGNCSCFCSMSDKEPQSLGPRGMDKMVWWNSASLVGLPDLNSDTNWKRGNNHCM